MSTLMFAEYNYEYDDNIEGGVHLLRPIVILANFVKTAAYII